MVLEQDTLRQQFHGQFHKATLKAHCILDGGLLIFTPRREGGSLPCRIVVKWIYLVPSSIPAEVKQLKRPLNP